MKRSAQRPLAGTGGRMHSTLAGKGVSQQLRSSRPLDPEEEKRAEQLRTQMQALTQVLADFRGAKSRLSSAILEAARAGTRQDRAEVLENRLALLENAKVTEVEWTIPDYSELVERCPKGQCIVSPTFCAAGIAGMQLVFHPNGNRDASEGFCSVALRTPEGTRVSRVLYVNETSLGPDIVKQACEGYTNACPVVPPSSTIRGTAGDIVVVGVRDLRQQGRLADPMLQRVLLLGDAPAAEVNFRLLREMRDLRHQEELKRFAEQQEAEAKERKQLEEEERLRKEAEQQAAAAQAVVQELPPAVNADDVIRQAALKMQEARTRAAVEKKESAEEKAERERKEKALAWLHDYQHKQAEEKAEKLRQEQEREQAEKEVRGELERKRKADERERQRRERDATRRNLETEKSSDAEREKQRKADEKEQERQARLEVEKRAQFMREKRHAEEEARRKLEEEERRLEQELKQQQEELEHQERERKRLAEERKRHAEEEREREEAEEQFRQEEQRLQNEEKRQRQEELRKMEEQRRAFQRAEEERMRKTRADEEDARRRKQEEARRQAEEVRQRKLEEERQRREHEERERERERQLARERENQRWREREEQEREQQRKRERARELPRQREIERVLELEREKEMQRDRQQQRELEMQHERERQRRAEQELQAHLHKPEDLQSWGGAGKTDAPDSPASGSGMAAGKALRRLGGSSREDGVPSLGSNPVGHQASQDDSDDSEASSGEEEEEEEVFDVEKFKLTRANVVPASGSNLRAWALAAAAGNDNSDADDSDDDELDWIKQRQLFRPGGVATAAAKPVALPSMRHDDEDDDSGSGSDVEPVFIRR